jgi:hypothetical protein
MFDWVWLATVCSVAGFVGWKGGRPEQRMAGTIFISWCIVVGLSWADRPHDGGAIGLAAGDVVLTVGMAICSHAETDQGTRRWLGLVQLSAAAAMVFGGVGRMLQAFDAGPVAMNFIVLNGLGWVGALAFLGLATAHRMKRKVEQRTSFDLGSGQLAPGPCAIH